MYMNYPYVLCIYMSICVFTCVCICIYIYINTHTFICIYSCIHIYNHKHIYIYVYICTYIYTCILTQTHTYMTVAGPLGSHMKSCEASAASALSGDPSAHSPESRLTLN